MKRRVFLLTLGGITLGSALGAGELVLHSSEAAGVAAILFKRLRYLRLDRESVSRFARDYTQRDLISARKLRAVSAAGPLYERIPQGWVNALMPGVPYGEERIVTTFLLSSDFFPQADEMRIVSYLGLFDAQVRSNPFARFGVSEFSSTERRRQSYESQSAQIG